jgi:UDP-2,3-diacylglucosamine hydrolase
MPTLFISDLHLDAERPEITALFGRFIDEEARGADALYILGDLFEAWVGDDDPSDTGRFVAEKLAALRASGVPVFFQRGNRDFLLGDAYASRAGVTILPDPAVILLHGQPTLLMHGDLLCTDDVAYQQFRAQTRDPRWQAQFLAQPLAARLAFAQQARTASQARHAELQGQGLMEAITDVAPMTVTATLARYGIDALIHGHTHRPAVHELDVDGRACQRIVLGDWYEQGSVLRVDSDSLQLDAL